MRESDRRGERVGSRERVGEGFGFKQGWKEEEDGAVQGGMWVGRAEPHTRLKEIGFFLSFFLSFFPFTFLSFSTWHWVGSKGREGRHLHQLHPYSSTQPLFGYFSY